MHRALLVVAILGLVALQPAPSRAAGAAGERIVLLSTDDVRGKTGPCGCTTPKGGLGRLAGFADSLEAQYGEVMIVDAGGFFPTENNRRDAAPFLMDAMAKLGYRAVGLGDHDLKFGLAFLRESASRAKLPLVSTNLVESASGKPVFPATRIVSQGPVKVGFFSVLDAKADLGPARDSLRALDPVAAAKQAVADLRAQGAHVVVALSNLGRMPSEDLCTAVTGIDVLIASNNVPLVEKGRLVDQTLVVYGGEQGQNAGRTIVTLDAAHHVTSKTATVFVMDPTFADSPEVTAMAKAFEAALLVRNGGAADSTHAASHP
jgi:5'-nucleotidase